MELQRFELGLKVYMCIKGGGVAIMGKLSWMFEIVHLAF